MSDTLEAVANLVEPVAMQAPLAREWIESGAALNPLSDEAARVLSGVAVRRR